MSEKKSELEVRELAEKFFEEEISKLDDPQRKEEVELEKETYIGVWMLGYRAGESTAEQPVREVDGGDFSKWILDEGFTRTESHDGKEWLWHDHRGKYGQCNFSPAQLWGVFKNQPPAEWSGEKETKEAVVIHNNSDAFRNWVSDIKGYDFALLGHSIVVWLPADVSLQDFEKEWEAYEKANNPAKKEVKS